jgi:pimeloyl-ACP methyl ester carboxylesterase
VIDDVGDPTGTPVVYLHGGGDSKLSRHPDDSIAATLGVRLLAVDRSGPLDRRRTLGSWAERTLAELPVERFAVVGWSAGGPHALALAAVAPERVSRAVIVAPLPPPDRSDLYPEDIRQAMRVGRVAPRYVAYRLERWGRETPAATCDAACDDAYARGRREAFRAGGRNLARELTYLGRPWDIDLKNVSAPVSVWCGTRDDVFPPAIGEVFAARLPSATVNLVDDTHQLLFSRWREILADAAQQTRP